MNNITTLKTPAVKLSEAEAAAYEHDHYLMQIREQTCHHCGCGEKWSELFEAWLHPIHTRRTSAVQLRPTTTIRKGYAINYLFVPTVVVPLCSECVEAFNPEEGVELVPAASHAAWHDTLARKYAPLPKPEKSGRPEVTLDML